MNDRMVVAEGVRTALTNAESRTIHEPKRLKILYVLKETQGIQLSTLQKIIGVSPSDLSHHLNILADLQMVKLARPTRGDTRYKSAELTQRGQDCFRRYRSEMLNLLD